MLAITDPYTAYCLDEAGAFLIGQKEPPNYKRLQMLPANRDKKQLALLQRLGAKVSAHCVG
jgi:hypothetical protein